MDVNHFMNLMNETTNVNALAKHCNSYGTSRDNIFLVGENGLSMTGTNTYDRDVVSALHSIESNDFNRGPDNDSGDVKPEVNFVSGPVSQHSKEVTRQNLERMVTRLDSIESMVNSIRREVCDLRSFIHSVCNKAGLTLNSSIGTFSQCHTTIEVERLAENLKEDSFYESMVRTCSEIIENGKDRFEMTQKILSFLIRKDVMGRINMSGRNQKLKFPPIITSIVHSSLSAKGECDFQDVEKLISRVLHNCIANLKRNQKGVGINHKSSGSIKFSKKHRTKNENNGSNSTQNDDIVLVDPLDSTLKSLEQSRAMETSSNSQPHNLVTSTPLVTSPTSVPTVIPSSLQSPLLQQQHFHQPNHIQLSPPLQLHSNTSLSSPTHQTSATSAIVGVNLAHLSHHINSSIASNNPLVPNSTNSTNTNSSTLVQNILNGR